MNIFSKQALMALWRDEEGASGIEYALIAAMVAVALVTFVDPIQKAVVLIFTNISETLTSAAS